MRCQNSLTVVCALTGSLKASVSAGMIRTQDNSGKGTYGGNLVQFTLKVNYVSKIIFFTFIFSSIYLGLEMKIKILQGVYSALSSL